MDKNLMERAPEIVGALRCCGNTDTKRPDCEHCPLMGPMCVKRMLEGAVALIEQLAAEVPNDPLTLEKLRERLKAYEDKIPFDRLDEAAALVKARKEGRVIVLPTKTVFEPVWDAGDECGLKCPERFDGLDTCQGCSKAVPSAYQRDCRPDDVIGKTVFLTRAEAEAALSGGGGDG